MFQPVLLEVYNFPMTSPVRPLGSNYTSVSFSMWESSRITVLASELTELCLQHVSSSIDAQFAKLSCAQNFSSNTKNKKYCRLVSLQFPPNYSTMDERR